MALLDKLLALFELTSPWELIAVLLALAYLLLAVQKNLWCWLAALLSSAIYVALTLDRRLYMQVPLNLYYVVMALYGYWEWRRGRDSTGEVMVTRWPISRHVVVVATVLVLSAISGWLLIKYTDAASPYVDSFVAWGSVITTWMVARRVIENWLYWIVVDGVAAYLFFRQGLPATGVLFVVYIGIVIHGYRVWSRDAKRMQDALTTKDEFVA